MLRYLTTIGLLLLSVAAVIWLVVCALSMKARQDRRRLAKRFAITAIVATPIVGYLLLFALNWWPPDSVERKTQRDLLQENVKAAGGWDAVRRACVVLAEQHEDDAFQWSRGNTNTLPGALAALKPKEVTFYSPKLLQKFKDETKVPVVRVKMFGIHSTGGNSSPYLGLEVVCDPKAEDYKPRPSRGGASGNCYTTYRKVAEDIYEIY